MHHHTPNVSSDLSRKVSLQLQIPAYVPRPLTDDLFQNHQSRQVPAVHGAQSSFRCAIDKTKEAVDLSKGKAKP